jgi:hypothetical protein
MTGGGFRQRCGQQRRRAISVSNGAAVDQKYEGLFDRFQKSIFSE